MYRDYFTYIEEIKLNFTLFYYMLLFFGRQNQIQLKLFFELYSLASVILICQGSMYPIAVHMQIFPFS